jgi:hypothetical protein
LEEEGKEEVGEKAGGWCGELCDISRRPRQMSERGAGEMVCVREREGGSEEMGVGEEKRRPEMCRQEFLRE